MVPPDPEPPRERLARLGAAALRDEDLLALLLRSGSMRESVFALAARVLKTFPLRTLATQPLGTLARLPGMGPSLAGTLVAAFELGRRGSQESAYPRLATVQDVAAQALEIRTKKKEYLLAFLVNARQELIAKEVISIGTLTASLAHPREIFTPAIAQAAAGIILVHNHPSGDPAPSDEDAKLTQRIQAAGRLLGIELLDHLILAEKGCYSFKTAGPWIS